MNIQKIKLIAAVAIMMSFTTTVPAQTTEFVYQGHLQNSAVPANGSFDFEFLLFDTLAGPNQVGTTQTRSGVNVTNGIFNVTLDFGSSYPGAPRFLDIRARPTGGGAFTPLTPRQPLTSAPYSVKSLNSDSSTNSLQLDGVAAANYLQTNGNGSGLTNLNGANIANNSIPASALAPDAFPNSQNLSLLGQRRWDRLGQRVSLGGPGTAPLNAAFDGANIWVTSFGSNSVTKLRASDGACVGTCTFAVAFAQGIAFDGANMWITTSGNNVVKLRASDGAVQGTFAAGVNPIAVAFDGANIWVANNSGNNVTKLRASDGAPQGTFAVGSSPSALEFDGENMWVANTASGNVTKLRASDGTLQGTFAVGAAPQGLAFDGANIWVANASGNVTKLRASDGTCVATCTFAVGSVSIGIAFDGANIWVANTNSNSVTKLRASDGSRLENYVIFNGPRGIAFDGASMWVVNANGNNVTKLPVFP